MKVKYIIFFIIISCLSSCRDTQDKNKNQVVIDSNSTKMNKNTFQTQKNKFIDSSKYSKEFLKYYRNSNILLRSDSVIFTIDNEIEVVKISTILPLDKEVSTDSTSLIESLKRINYTDIIIKSDSFCDTSNAIASLRPDFHLGAETIEVNGEVCFVDIYEVSDCNSKIGLERLQSLKQKFIRIFIIVNGSAMVAGMGSIPDGYWGN